MKKILVVLMAAMLLVGLTAGAASAGIWTYEKPATTDTQTVTESGDGWTKTKTISSTEAVKAIYIGPTLPSWWPWGS